MQYPKIMDIQRTQQSALYFAANIRDLYVVKLLKLFYYLDFIAVKETGRSITKDTYFHLPYGPIPSFIKDNIGLLNPNIKNEEVKALNPNAGFEAGKRPEWLNESSIFDGILELNSKGKGNVIISKIEMNSDDLSAYEKDLLRDIVKDLGGKSVTEIVEKTHQESPYTQTLSNQVIPYDLAFQLDVSRILPSRRFESDKEIAYSRFVSS